MYTLDHTHKYQIIMVYLPAAEYTFPYVKKRLQVCARREIELCPIQVAIDEMCQRVRELRQTISAQPTDIKKLQLRLQVIIDIIYIYIYSFMFVFRGNTNFLLLMIGPCFYTFKRIWCKINCR